MDKILRLEMPRQPNDTTCGPTSLHAVYRFFGDRIPLARVIEEVRRVENGGTLAVMLAVHALKRGYRARLHTYDLHLFDPTWFREGMDMRKKLIAQAKVKPDPKLHTATRALLEFLDLGGELVLADLRPELLREALDRSRPVITGLSATWLYRSSRERGWDDEWDDVRGQSAGHFVVLSGYFNDMETVLVADPLRRAPASTDPRYGVPVDRLINAILLGVLSYDGNLLVLEPPEDLSHE